MIVRLPTAVAASSDSGRRGYDQGRIGDFIGSRFYRPNFFFPRGVVACITGGKTGQKPVRARPPGKEGKEGSFCRYFPGFMGKLLSQLLSHFFPSFPGPPGGFRPVLGLSGACRPPCRPKPGFYRWAVEPPAGRGGDAGDRRPGHADADRGAVGPQGPALKGLAGQYFTDIEPVPFCRSILVRVVVHRSRGPFPFVQGKCHLLRELDVSAPLKSANVDHFGAGPAAKEPRGSVGSGPEWPRNDNEGRGGGFATGPRLVLLGVARFAQLSTVRNRILFPTSAWILS